MPPTRIALSETPALLRSYPIDAVPAERQRSSAAGSTLAVLLPANTDVYLGRRHWRPQADCPQSQNDEVTVQDSAPPESRGKVFHDPLAASCAIEPSIATRAEVELFRKKGAWGSRLQPGSRTFIITDYQPERFFAVLTASARSSVIADGAKSA